MDTTDRQILSLLAADGRMSYTDVGKATGLSTSAAQQRVRRLEQRGIITGYRAVVDPAALGMMLTALIELTPFDLSSPDTVAKDLEDIPEVTSCWSVAGKASYVIKVEVASPENLDALLSRIHQKAGCSTLTTLILSIPYENRLHLPQA